MKILFTHSYFYKLDPKQWRFKQPYPPLGTMLAAAVAREAGHQVVLFDTNLRDSPLELVPLLAVEKPDCVVIYDDGFNYLTKMCLTTMREAAFVMAAESRKRGCTVIVSSSDAADHYEKYLEHGADFVIRGEGEETLKALLDCLHLDHSVDTLEGIVRQSPSGPVVNPQRPVMRDLDALPLPAWDLVDIDAYRRIWTRHHGYFSLNLATTRGCPFKCNWCAKPIYGTRYTSRSPGHVVEEIVYLIQQFNPDHFWMCDDIFGLKPGWVQTFSQLVREKGLKFRYKIQSRVDLLLEADTVGALAASGVETVWVGAESGAQKVLDAMDKGTTVSQIYEATTLLRQQGIRTGFFLQFGYPGETRVEISQTLQMVLDLMPDEIGISVSYPLPGTVFYDNVRGQLAEKQNWSDSGDLAMMFQGTYSGAYYRELHRYVHAVYRKQKGYSFFRKLFSQPLRLNYNDLRSGTAAIYFAVAAFVQRLRLNRLEHAAR
jgi:anaerobic magnesium-protoporphyrin IX monomethyl ester cyclase